MEDSTEMSENENRRTIVLKRVDTGALSLEQATRILNLSYRQLKRVWKRYREEGEHGLSHRSKGRPSNRAFQEELRTEVLRRYHDRHLGLGPTQFAGKLAEEGIFVDHETLRRWLLESGCWKLQRSRLSYRAPEPATTGFGEVLSLACIHDAWLGADSQPLFLHCLRDEATSYTLFLLSADESCAAAMRLLWVWLERFGIPVALRCPRRFCFDEDRHPTLDQQLEGRESHSALALSAERVGMDLAVIGPARVKSLLSDLQPAMEALRAELRRLPGMGVESVNTLLRGGVGEAVNQGALPRIRAALDCHVAVVDGTDLRRFLCVERECRVERSGLVECGGRTFRLVGGFSLRAVRPYRVVVSEWLDGSIHIRAEGKEVPFVEVRREPTGPERLAI
jgi:transposase